MKKVIVSIFLSLFVFTSMLAQGTPMTPYEKARKDLADKTLTKIFDSMSEIDKLAFSASFLMSINQTDDIFEQTDIAESFIYGLCGIGETFKTEADYLSASLYAPTVYTGSILKDLESIGKNYAAQRKELDKTMTPNDKARDAERAKSKTSIGRIKNGISKAFLKWTQKGEFEKTFDYEERLKSYAKEALDSICFSQLNESWRKDATIRKGKYDADSDMQSVDLIYRNPDYTISNTFSGSFPFTPEYSKHLDTNNFDISLSYANGFMLCNGLLVPSSLNLVINIDGDSIKKYDVDFGKSEPISFRLEDFHSIPDITKEILSGYVFDYSDYTTSCIPYMQLLEEIYNIREQYESSYPIACHRISFEIEKSNAIYVNYGSNTSIPHKTCLIPSSSYENSLTSYDQYCSFEVYKKFLDNTSLTSVIPYESNNVFFHAGHEEDTYQYIYDCLFSYVPEAFKNVQLTDFYSTSDMKHYSPSIKYVSIESVSQYLSFLKSIKYFHQGSISETNANELAKHIINSNPEIQKAYNNWLKSSDFKYKLSRYKERLKENKKLQRYGFSTGDDTQLNELKRIIDYPEACFVFSY